MLHAADGLSNKAIGERLDTPRPIVSKWRKRFFERRLAGLGDEPQRGRPRGFPPDVVVAVKALAGEIPHDTGLPLSRLSRADIRREAINRGIVADIGGTTIWRWLHEDAIKPRTHRSWVFPRDPQFAAKAGPILDLYQGRWQGEPLSDRDFVLCADEKPSIQARRREHSPGAPVANRPMRGARVRQRGCLHLNCRLGCPPRQGVRQLRSQVVNRPLRRPRCRCHRAAPYNRARRVFWIMDNASIHRGRRGVERFRRQWADCQVVHTPIHASWLNQVENYFSIVQHKVLTPSTSPTSTSSNGTCASSSATTRRSPIRSNGLMPWERLEARIEPFYAKAGRGRRAYPLGTMLRIHCVQLLYNLSDPGMEDLLYEAESVRRFAGLRLLGRSRTRRRF